MQLSAAELEAMLIYQIGALAGIAQAEGGRLTHVKPHGALNNMACEDAALAASVVAAIRSLDRSLILLAPALSKLALAGAAAGLRWRPKFLPTGRIRTPAVWCRAASPARCCIPPTPVSRMSCACSTRAASSAPVGSASRPSFTASACMAMDRRRWPRRPRFVLRCWPRAQPAAAAGSAAAAGRF
jgi:hypothetical protein